MIIDELTCLFLEQQRIEIILRTRNYFAYELADFLYSDADSISEI